MYNQVVVAIYVEIKVTKKKAKTQVKIHADAKFNLKIMQKYLNLLYW